MSRITIDLTKGEMDVLKKRAKQKYLDVKELVEDIIRRSCIRTKGKTKSRFKCDDKLVHIFSREKRTKKKKVKKKVTKKKKK